MITNKFGQAYVRTLINFNKSVVGHLDRFQKVQEQLDAGDNVVLLANHQTEADPGVWALLLEKVLPRLATEIIYVAGMGLHPTLHNTATELAWGPVHLHMLRLYMSAFAVSKATSFCCMQRALLAYATSFCLALLSVYLCRRQSCGRSTVQTLLHGSQPLLCTLPKTYG